MYQYNRKGTSKCDLYSFLSCPLFGVSTTGGSTVLRNSREARSCMTILFPLPHSSDVSAPVGHWVGPESRHDHSTSLHHSSDTHSETLHWPALRERERKRRSQSQSPAVREVRLASDPLDQVPLFGCELQVGEH